MSEFPIGVIPKVWGWELWVVNEPEYCCKILSVKKGASGSLHYHLIKKESFMVSGGRIELECGDGKMILQPSSKAVTILPRVPHRFRALKESMLLEISTHHDDADVVRIEESRA